MLLSHPYRVRFTLLQCIIVVNVKVIGDWSIFPFISDESEDEDFESDEELLTTGRIFNVWRGHYMSESVWWLPGSVVAPLSGLRLSCYWICVGLSLALMTNRNVQWKNIPGHLLSIFWHISHRNFLEGSQNNQNNTCIQSETLAILYRHTHSSMAEAENHVTSKANN